MDNTLPYALRTLKIQNYAAIHELSIESISDNTDSANWVFFIGENGFGKTSILRAIAIGLYGVADGPVRLFEPNTEKNISVRYSDTTTIVEHSTIGGRLYTSFKNIVCYGPSRLQVQTDQTQNEIERKSTTTYNLFNVDGILLNIGAKMVDWHLHKDPRFNKVKHLFLTLIPYLADIDIDIPTRKVKYTEKEPIEAGKTFEPVFIEDLATGFRGIIQMVGDMVLRLSESQPDVKELAELAGIVIIDELDLHWHPKIQRELPRLLSETFPKVQFIASTHSLVPLLGAPKNSAFFHVNRNKKEGITAQKIPFDIEALSADEILRDIFDLEKYLRDDKHEAWKRYIDLTELIRFEKQELKKEAYINERTILGDKYHFPSSSRIKIINKDEKTKETP